MKKFYINEIKLWKEIKYIGSYDVVNINTLSSSTHCPYQHIVLINQKYRKQSKCMSKLPTTLANSFLAFVKQAWASLSSSILSSILYNK